MITFLGVNVGFYDMFVAASVIAFTKGETLSLSAVSIISNLELKLGADTIWYPHISAPSEGRQLIPRTHSHSHTHTWDSRKTINSPIILYVFMIILFYAWLKVILSSAIKYD